jgi:phosphoribosylamine--glycine ligase
MHIAIIGSGGREHALAVKSLHSPLVSEVHVIPGNTGMLMTTSLKLYSDWNGSFTTLEQYLTHHSIELIIVGNESYLAEGIADYFEHTSIQVFGPSQAAAQLETSKNFAKQFMVKHHIPTAGYVTCTSYEEAIQQLDSQSGTIVIKQDGLALGKGVLVTDDKVEAKAFLKASFAVSNTVIFEDFLGGKEFSLLAFVNRDYCNVMQPARDYKRAGDGDTGLNTGGMGAYTPVEYITDADMATVTREIVHPTISGLLQEQLEFTGILYFGLMKTPEGIKVIEYNTRFGDPEAEVLLEAMESDLIEAIQATFARQKYPLKWKAGATLGVCLAAEGYPQLYQKGHPIAIPKGVSCYSMAMKKEDDHYTSNGGRVLFTVASAVDLATAKRTCYAHIQKIVYTGLYYRNDIGA